jgi:hypothetical protein
MNGWVETLKYLELLCYNQAEGQESNRTGVITSDLLGGQ